MARSTNTSTSHHENKAVTRQDLNILASNLSQTFADQLRNVVALQNPPQQYTNTEINTSVATMAQKIKKLQTMFTNKKKGYP